MAHKPNFTAELTNKAAVYEISKSLGFVQTRGANVGSGSPREMLEAIGAGNALVVHLADDTEYAMVKDLKRIAKDERSALADLLNRIAAALELAEKMSQE